MRKTKKIILTLLSIACSIFCITSISACNIENLENTNSSQNETSTIEELSPAEIYQKVNPSVAFVLVQTSKGYASGTGFFIDDKGTLVTNYHVIDGWKNAKIQLANKMQADVISVSHSDSDMDIAILTTNATNTTPVDIGNSDNVQIGETVYAIGYPEAFTLGISSSTFTSGMVSMNRTIGENTYIQSTVDITHGNSGGPLINTAGEVIGITSAGINYQNIDYMNLSIPINNIEIVKNSINVQFYLNGTLYKNQKIAVGSLIQELTIPKKTGYTFSGWCLDTNCTIDFDFSKCIVGSTIIYGKMIPEVYTITFNTNGGTISSTSKTVTYDECFTLPTPERNGYTFKGWKYNNKSFTSGTWRYTTDILLVAEWEANKNTIKYILNGGVNPSTQLNSYITGTETILKEPTKTGYTFQGWTTTGITQPQKEITISASDYGEKTFTAHWTVNTYTVAFNAKGGTCSATSKNITYDSAYTLPTPTRNGYTFEGWYYNSVLCDSELWNIAENCTLIADWKANTNQITYDLGGGTNAIDNPETYLTGTTVVLQNPTKTGYTFDGWTTTGITTPTKNIKILSTDYGDKTFKANWTVNTYKVSFNANGGTCSTTTKDITYDSTYSLPTPSRTGYTFKGWTYNSSVYTNRYWKIASNCTLYAKWEANTDTPYIINHYIQNLENDEYSFKESESLKGTTDSYITPTRKSYTGFSAPTGQRVQIKPDGSLIVNYYYTRNNYTITFVANGGQAINSITQKYESVLSIPSTSRTDYTFGGWFEDIKLSTAYGDTIMPAYNNTVYAWWKEENKPTDFTYSETTGISITAYNGIDTTMWIPSYIGGIAVTTIPSEAFIDKTELVKIVVPNTVTSIGLSAFQGCNSLESMTLPFVGKSENATYYESVFGYIFGYDSESLSTTSSSHLGYVNAAWGTQANNTVFQYSYYTYSHTYGGFAYYTPRSYYYYIPSSIKIVTITQQENIPEAAFNNCSFVESITIPNHCTSIGNYAFQNCAGLTEIVIPESVTSIGTDAFKECTGLTSVNIINTDSWCKISFANAYSNPMYYAKDFYCNNEIVTNITLPADITSIQKYAFYNLTSLSEVVIGDNITVIGEFAFYNCAGLTEVVIPNSVTSIGLSAFQGCNSLESMTLPFVGKSANATYYESVFGYIFGYDSESLSDTHASPSGYINVAWGTQPDNTVFQYSHYIYSHTYAGATYSNPWSYYYYIPNSIKEVTITEQDSIPEAAFNNCSFIETITLPNNCTKIGSYAFQNCTGLTEIVIPESVTSIGMNAFYGCTGLTSIIIPAHIEMLGDYAFMTGNEFTKLYYMGTVDNWCEINFPSVNANLWSYSQNVYFGDVVIGEINISSATKINRYAFQNCEYLTEVVIDGLTITVGDYAFSACNNLKRVYIGKQLQKIEDYAFAYCENLEQVEINDAPTFIDNYAFYECVKLVNFNMGNAITSINTYVFYGCTSLTNINLPNTLTFIGHSAFYNCNSLTNIIIPNLVTSISAFSFYGCSSVTSLIIGNQVTSIGESAFKNCKIIDLKIPNSVTKIERSAFANCGIETLELGSSINTIESYAFRGLRCKSIIIPISVTEIEIYAFDEGVKNLIIYCEAEERPYNWHINWCNRTYNSAYAIIWGYKQES